MTTLAPQSIGPAKGILATRLVRSELLKIRTTKAWWLFALGTIATSGLALLVNLLTAHSYLTGKPPNDADRQAIFDLNNNVISQAARIYTSGQFFGGFFAMLLAILLITNEYHHQTATTTFLVTPRRTAVVLSKFVTAMMAAVFFWGITTVMNVIAAFIYLPTEGYSNHITDTSILQAIALNLMVFALWGVFGLGLGVLMRSQIGATITAAVLYVVGSTAIQLIFFLIHEYLIHRDGVFTAMVVVPSTAAQIAVSPNQLFPHSPPQWTGAAVLIGYGLIMGTIGTLIMRKRDIT
jgi:ABC-type transport system involved in multi-copper enzyme maturation permease subunit